MYEIKVQFTITNKMTDNSAKSLINRLGQQCIDWEKNVGDYNNKTLWL